MTQPKTKYLHTFKDEIDSWFDFESSNSEVWEHQYEKAQEFLSYMDYIRTTFSNRLTIKRTFK